MKVVEGSLSSVASFWLSTCGNQALEASARKWGPRGGTGPPQHSLLFVSANNEEIEGCAEPWARGLGFGTDL